MDMQSLLLLSNLSFRDALAKVCQQTHTSIFREQKGVKNHILALIEGPQGADSGPEAVGGLGHQEKDLYFHLGYELLADFARI
jgi:hypothetical protein